MGGQPGAGYSTKYLLARPAAGRGSAAAAGHIRRPFRRGPERSVRRSRLAQGQSSRNRAVRGIELDLHYSLDSRSQPQAGLNLSSANEAIEHPLPASLFEFDLQLVSFDRFD